MNGCLKAHPHSKVIQCHEILQRVKEEKEGEKEQSLQIQRGPIYIFRCRVPIDRSTHPPSFMRRAGCHTSFGFPGGAIRCDPCGVADLDREWFLPFYSISCFASIEFNSAYSNWSLATYPFFSSSKPVPTIITQSPQ